MKSSFSHAECYWQYLQNCALELSAVTLANISSILENTSWDTPVSILDWNNLAVIALIEAEQCGDNLAMRSVYLEMACDALNNGVELGSHPLCVTHIALIHSMLGEAEEAMQMAFSTFINTLQPAYSNSTEDVSLGLIYLPATKSSWPSRRHEHDSLELILQAEDGYQESLLLLSEVLCRSQLVFYNATGRRLLHLAAQLLPHSVSIWLKLGISSLMSGQLEGLLYLHRARHLAPSYAPTLQALYLVYQDLKQIELADFWLKIARSFHQQNSNSPDWYWTRAVGDSSLTYVPFEDSLIMAVEASLHSIVTSVLVAEGNWFEKEMEFWRSWIKPGMTVIDVGANVGVYTFSAARQVGPEGRVLAVEPFSKCISCLQETCKINQLSWVTVCIGAASNRNGTLQLLLHSASELNEIVSDDVAANTPTGSFEKVNCFTLDSLVEQENLATIDFLKIDAEGHEMAVLEGSNRILTQFEPVILYENIGGSQGSNSQVAEYLNNKGYKLFRYQPYKQELIPVNSNEDCQGQLNLIAMPLHQISNLSL
jgi:FkbM family methyltransferase